MTPPARRGDIQGLRALAVGAVVLSHAGVTQLAGGYVGVDVFFVVSGFLITGILVRGVRREGRISLTDFYARRARRILPAAAVTLVGITIASWFAFGYIRLDQVLRDVTWAAFFGENINAARSGTDYFASDGFVSPVQHFWSLSVEEQFYVLWPALVAVVLVLARRRPLRALGFTLSAICGVSLAWCVLQSTADPTSAYFSTLTRVWELGAGALLALLAHHLRQLTRGFLSLLSWVGVAMIAWSCLAYTSTTVFPGRAALVPVVGTVLVLAGGIRPTPYGASWLLDRAPMRKLGDISYSLYLVHWPLLVIPVMATGHEQTPTRRAALVALAITLAAISYRWVETPFRSAEFWQRGRARALALWPAAVAFVLVGVTVVGTQVGTTTATATHPVLDPAERAAPSSSQAAVQSAQARAAAAAAQAAEVQLAVTRAASRSTARTSLPSRLTPSPLQLKNANWRLPDHCWASTQATRHDICSMGDTDAARTLVLFGDSHIGMWTAPIVRLADEAGWKVVVFLKTGCPPIDTPAWRNDGSRRYRECDRWRTWAYRNIARIHPDRIITTGYTQTAIADPKTGKELRGDDGAAGTRALVPGMRSALAKLTAASPQVTVLADNTTLPEATADCLGERNATLRTCAAPLNPTTAARNAAWSAAARVAGAGWVDTTAWLCPKNVCPLVVGNVVVYTDRHHLTRTFAQSLSPLLAAALTL
ncbi:acyltransferase family protein [Marmoricola sp. RAF53]|uniref:acyltransferase family protein n=1 Tax=Marmoricola sp. RAF53 TaxID=3233059 RepID=UPI003F98DC3C